MFGGRVRAGSTMSDELEDKIKRLSAATVKFSNDKILKATGLLRDALQLYRKGPKAGQEDFNRLFSILESVKSDRSSIPFAQHMEAVVASLPAFAVALLPEGPARKEHLVGCHDSAQYYLNRIIKAAKDVDDANNLEWATTLNELLLGLIKVGGSSSGAAAATEAVSTMKLDTNKQPKPAEVEEECNGFVAINSTTRPTGDQSPLNVEPTTTDSTAEAVLEGNRWYIRKVCNAAEPVLVTPEGISQALAIEDSRSVAIKVDGKINAVLADACTRLDLEVSDVVSSVELVGCNRVRLFLQGQVRVVVLDGCEGVQIYLSEPSKMVQIVTSKCMEINVVALAGLLDEALTGEEAEEYQELAIPVQFYTHVGDDGKLVTVAHEHVGA